jgi:hypothetical protein
MDYTLSVVNRAQVVFMESIGSSPAASKGARADWRVPLARALLWSVVAKLAGLLLLWWLFFSGHLPPDAASVSRHLHLG